MLWTKVLSALKGLTYPEIFSIVMFGKVEVLHKSISILCSSKQHCLLYTTLICSAKFFSVLVGICATLNSHIQALKLFLLLYGCIFEGWYFGAIMGSAKVKCL